jgi:23S rRNA pseudouridine955/2504/2580 synthase
VQAPLRKNVLQGGERVVKVDPAGKRAESVFRPLERSEHASLIEVTLRTGRMHQIRVHAAHMGHPVAGDPKYGSPEFNRFVAQHGTRRLLLHAARLAIPRPGEQPLHVKAPLDEELERTLRSLGLRSAPRARS